MPETRSRVTIVSGDRLLVAESGGDFASTVLERLVKEEHTPQWTHNPPTVILLEDVPLDLPLHVPTQLALDTFATLKTNEDA